MWKSAHCTHYTSVFLLIIALPTCISLNFCLHPSIPSFLHLCSLSDLDKEVMTLKENHPYIALVVGVASLQTFLTAQRRILEPLKKGLTTLDCCLLYI